MPKNVKTLFSSAHNIEQELATTDLVIGAVLIPGAKAPHLITRPMLKLMKKGSVLVDVAIDQGVVLRRHTQPHTPSRHTKSMESFIIV